jgi:nucleotide-binding universal stress UspA family protein
VRAVRALLPLPLALYTWDETKEDAMKILLATDGSDCSGTAARAIADRPWPDGTVVRVVTVAELPVAIAPESWILPEGYFEEIERASQHQAEGAVAAAAKTIAAAQGDRVAVETAVLVGAPKHAIIEEAERWGAELIVVGSHGYNAFERFLLGSVSQSIAHHAKCSVEIVRGPTCAGAPKPPVETAES